MAHFAQIPQRGKKDLFKAPLRVSPPRVASALTPEQRRIAETAPRDSTCALDDRVRIQIPQHSYLEMETPPKLKTFGKGSLENRKRMEPNARRPESFGMALRSQKRSRFGSDGEDIFKHRMLQSPMDTIIESSPAQPVLPSRTPSSRYDIQPKLPLKQPEHLKTEAALIRKDGPPKPPIRIGSSAATLQQGELAPSLPPKRSSIPSAAEVAPQLSSKRSIPSAPEVAPQLRPKRSIPSAGEYKPELSSKRSIPSVAEVAPQLPPELAPKRSIPSSAQFKSETPLKPAARAPLATAPPTEEAQRLPQKGASLPVKSHPAVDVSVQPRQQTQTSTVKESYRKLPPESASIASTTSVTSGPPLPYIRDPFFGPGVNIYQLRNESFTDFINDMDVSLVMFYQPKKNPGWSKKQIIQAAEKTVRPNHGYAAVDCSTETNLCKVQEIISYPTFKVFSKGSYVGAFRDYAAFSAEVMKKYVETTPVITQASRPTCSERHIPKMINVRL